MLHKKRLQDLIDLFSKKEKLHQANNKHVLHQLEILQIEIERDLIQNSYNTVDEFAERLKIK